MKISHLLLILALAVPAAHLNAQVSHGGVPQLSGAHIAKLENAVTLIPENLQALMKEDRVLDQHKDIPFRFGANIPTDLDLANSGSWGYTPSGTRQWRLLITSPGAQSINLFFDQYVLPDGGRVFVYTPSGSQILGSFTSANASPDHTLAVGFIYNDSLVVEYQEPVEAKGQGLLHISTVTHGYRNFMSPLYAVAKSDTFGDSGPCNINVNCPVALPFTIQKKSVGIMVVGNNGFCSGALVNNVNQDQTPYFLTANHCLAPNQDTLNNLLVYFNHEHPDCEGNLPAPADQSVSGAIIRARSAQSDFCLLELNSSVPASYDVCFSGWDASDVASNVTNAFGMHHPGGDTKKFCREANAPYHQSTTFNGNSNTQMWWIDQWEEGVTEPGSSGSPLFRQDGRLIGVLSGGAAACAGTVNNGAYDFYGRFGVAWDYAPQATANAKSWLDPDNTGILDLPPLCQSSPVALDAQAMAINNTASPLCSSTAITPTLLVSNMGTSVLSSMDISLLVNGVEVATTTWSGTLESFDATEVGLPQASVISGANAVSATITAVNGEADQNVDNNTATAQVLVISNPVTLELEITLDDYPGETSWDLTSISTGAVVYSGGGYSEGGTTVTESLCLSADSCYEFTIYDEVGDGLCCDYGIGSYLLSSSVTGEIASGAVFDFQEATTFCLPPLSATHEEPSQTTAIYPNPARTQVQISSGDLQLREIRLFDLSGRVVYQSSVSAATGTFSVDVSALSAGVYLVQLAGTSATEQHELIIAP